MEETQENLEMFASEGLRTLICAKRNISQKAYDEWNKTFQVACCALSDREAEIAKAAELIEQQLELVGVTAIEDKLQDAVPDTISELAEVICFVV